MRKIAIVASLIVVGFFALQLGGAMQSDSDRLTTATQAMPADEKAFVTVVADSGGDKWIYANVLQLVPMRRERAAKLCSTVPGGQIKDWVGRIDEISSTNRGGVVLRVYLYSDRSVDIENWNDKTNSNIDKMPIQEGSSMFNALSQMKQYDLISFDGEFQHDPSDCFRTTGSRTADMENNLAVTMMNPVFMFHFTDIRPLKRRS